MVQGMTEHLAYSIKEAAAAISLSERTIWQMIKRGELPTVKVGGRTLIPADRLRALIHPEG